MESKYEWSLRVKKRTHCNASMCGTRRLGMPQHGAHPMLRVVVMTAKTKNFFFTNQNKTKAFFPGFLDSKKTKRARDLRDSSVRTCL